MRQVKRSPARLLAFVLVLSAAITITNQSMRWKLAHARFAETLSVHVTQLRDTADHALERAYNVRALVLGAEGGEMDLSRSGPDLYKEDVDLRAVILAPGGIVTQCYPTAGNEDLLGTDIGTLARNCTPVVSTTSSLQITHPFALTSDAYLVAGYLPVELPQPDGTTRDWGMVAACLDFPDMLLPQGEDPLLQAGFVYRILLVEEDGSSTLVLDQGFGAPDSAAQAVSRDFSLAAMPLRIEALPAQGWISPGQVAINFCAVFLVMALLGALAEVLSTHFRKILREARADDLTGLLSRSSAESAIRSILNGKDFKRGAFLMVDLDNFKQVNDRLGHQRGDDVLRECAAGFRRIFRETDIVCRLGGDEFIIFLPFQGDLSFLERKLGTLRNSFPHQVVGETGEVVSISASIGIAMAPEHGTDFGTLYHNADAALYQAKAQGRDRNVYYTPDQHPHQKEPTP